MQGGNELDVGETGETVFANFPQIQGLKETYLWCVKEDVELAYLLPSANLCWTILEWTSAKEQQQHYDSLPTD